MNLLFCTAGPKQRLYDCVDCITSVPMDRWDVRQGGALDRAKVNWDYLSLQGFTCLIGLTLVAFVDVAAHT